MFREFRRSTRVSLSVTIQIEGQDDIFAFDGETIAVNLHGALVRTAMALLPNERVVVRVYLTGKQAAARVVHIAPDNALHCGIELDVPQNIWGVPIPPADWDELQTGRI